MMKQLLKSSLHVHHLIIPWVVTIFAITSDDAISGALAAPASIIKVGPGMTYSKPSEAAVVAKDGDVIEIIAATYRGDVAIWRQSHLIIRGVYALK